ncbi:MAG: Methylated-DNA--protein-cysteine methyltransferase [Chlamydiia bacterium]|nr:Methylated-DNA--protein-cysteine methyltransferase [Chlamydiia bacterium]
MSDPMKDYHNEYICKIGALYYRLLFMKHLISAQIKTPLGDMLAIADESALYLLEFVDCPSLTRAVESLRKRYQSPIFPGSNSVIDLITHELKLYFGGKLREFTTPVTFFGTPFQERTWQELQKIPFGKTWSYSELAVRVGKPTAYRAVAQANGANQLPIIIPCHRVINANGDLGGYNGSIRRKKWLFDHESSL